METLPPNKEETLNVSNYSYLKPNESLVSSFAVFPKEYVKSVDENQLYTRHFFSQVEYDDLETMNVKNFRIFLGENHVELPEYFDDSHILRFLYCCNFTYPKTLKKITDHLNAYKGYIFQVTPKMKNVEEGVFYLYGRDKNLRPIVHIVFSKLLAKIKDKAFNEKEILEDLLFLLECVKQNMLVPGKIEKWVIFIDVKGLTLNIPLKIIQRIVGVMEDLYPLYLEKIYVLNPSHVFQTLYKMAEKTFLKKSHTDKIFVLSDVNLKAFYEFVPLHQITTKFGGELPELEKFWPPVNTLDKFMREEEKKEKDTNSSEGKIEENQAEFNQTLKEIMFEKKMKKDQKSRMCQGINCFRSSEKPVKSEENLEGNLENQEQSCRLI